MNARPVDMAGMKGRKGRRAQTLAQPGRATVRDVAAAAGVSPMTVSNLINERSGTMRAETRQRIETEIKRLGYRPHATARSLRLAKQLSIGMIIIDEQPHYLADPFTTHIVAGLKQSAQLPRLWPAPPGDGTPRFRQLLPYPRHPQRCALHHDVGSRPGAPRYR